MENVFVVGFCRSWCSWLGLPSPMAAHIGRKHMFRRGKGNGLANTSRLMKFPRNFLHVGLEGSYWSILTWHHEGRLWLVRGCEQAGSSTEASLHKNILAAEISSVSAGHVLHFYKKHIGGFTLSQTTDTPQGWTHTMVIFQQVQGSKVSQKFTLAEEWRDKTWLLYVSTAMLKAQVYFQECGPRL